MEATSTSAPRLTLEAALKNENGRPRGHAYGELLILRPVLRADLPALAGMLAENPLPHKPGPWTLQRLTKAYEDEKKPGLWNEQWRIYIAVDGGGRACGYARESSYWVPGLYRAEYWIALTHPQRDSAGIELVQLHSALLRDWNAARRINTRALTEDDQRREWFAACGFGLDYVEPDCVWQLGRLVGQEHWVSYSEGCAPEGSDPGEPERSAEISAAHEW
jgi:hypothetical protein